MVLIALDRLGATPQRLDEWYETYRDAHAVPPIPEPVAPVDPENWQDALGERSREADYRGFLSARCSGSASTGRSAPICRR
nr:questin oxidase family protein [Marinicella sp. W31]MDC2878398.1 questin oxidase family protein [Marinicella sp. W31]